MDSNERNRKLTQKMKTTEEIQLRIDHLAKELREISTHKHGFALPKRKRGRLPIALQRIRIRERASYIEGKLKALRWVLKQGING